MSEEKTIDIEKPLEEATQDAKSEMSAEEQQAILKQIIQQAKQRSILGIHRKSGKMVSPNASKKRKAKSKMQKKSRKNNRKK